MMLAEAPPEVGIPDLPKAACAGHPNPELWFSPTHTKEAQQAKEICAGCPEQRKCLAYGMDDPYSQGIWGGYTAEERGRSETVALTCARCHQRTVLDDGRCSDCQHVPLTPRERRQQRIAICRDLLQEGRTPKEIAAVFGVTLTAAYKYIWAVRK